MTTGILRWEDPPLSAKAHGLGNRGNRSDKWISLASALRQRVGEWAVVCEDSSGVTSGLALTISRARTNAWQPAGSFEAVSRRVDGVWLTYARYTGGVQ